MNVRVGPPTLTLVREGSAERHKSQVAGMLAEADGLGGEERLLVIAETIVHSLLHLAAVIEEVGEHLGGER